MAGDGLIVGCFDSVTVSGQLTEVASILIRTGIIYKWSCQNQHTKTLLVICRVRILKQPKLRF